MASHKFEKPYGIEKVTKAYRRLTTPYSHLEALEIASYDSIYSYGRKDPY